MLAIFDITFCDFTPLSVMTKVLLPPCTLDHFTGYHVCDFQQEELQMTSQVTRPLHLKLFMTVLGIQCCSHSQQKCSWSFLDEVVHMLLEQISFSLYGDAANYSMAATKQGQHVIAEIHVQYAQGTVPHSTVTLMFSPLNFLHKQDSHLRVLGIDTHTHRMVRVWQSW